MFAHFQSKKLDPAVGKIIDATINRELAFSVFKQIADTPGPSQTVSYSRGRTIERVLNQHIHHSKAFRFELDYRRTGNIAVMRGDIPRAVFVAHADEISYLLGAEPLSEEIQLTPFGSHRAKDGYAVVSLRYNRQEHNLRQTASGSMISRTEANRLVPYLILKEGKVEIGDRIIFDHPAILDEQDLMHGKVDNAAGVSACLLAIIVLAQLEPAQPVWFVFTDEEEGPPESNSMFARGARRFVQGLQLPSDTLCVVVDGHDTEPGRQPSTSALFIEKESQCRGSVVPPHLYAEFKAFANYLRNLGINISENSRYVSRSDSPALMEYFRNMLLLGYPVRNPHFDDSPPCTSLEAVLSLAKTIVWMVLALDIDR